MIGSGGQVDYASGDSLLLNCGTVEAALDERSWYSCKVLSTYLVFANYPKFAKTGLAMAQGLI